MSEDTVDVWEQPAMRPALPFTNELVGDGFCVARTPLHVANGRNRARRDVKSADLALLVVSEEAFRGLAPVASEHAANALRAFLVARHDGPGEPYEQPRGRHYEPARARPRRPRSGRVGSYANHGSEPAASARPR